LLWRLLAHGATEDSDECRIEGGAGLLFDFLQGDLNRDGYSVWFVGSEVVEGLCERHNSRQERDTLFFQAEWIAGAVPAFVMQRDDLDGFGGEPHSPSDACAKVGSMVAPATVELQHGAALSADQIQIMGQGAKRKVLLLRQRQLKLVGDERRVEAYPVAVIDQMAISCF